MVIQSIHLYTLFDYQESLDYSRSRPNSARSDPTQPNYTKAQSQPDPISTYPDLNQV